jgi:hypothetical protein
MRQQITLRNVEEGLCNRIARRLLIPDEFLVQQCPVIDWLKHGESFFTKLSAAARDLGISRDCLLVRLQDVAPEVTSHCALLVRIISGFFPVDPKPSAYDRFYPGAEWSSFGRAALDFMAERLKTGHPVLFPLHLDLGNRGGQDSLTLRGWGRIISPQTALIWGQLG